jgi:hypothetical protein
MSITISTCYYILKSKFDHRIYLQWCSNFLSLIETNNFKLVLYTNEESFEMLISNDEIKRYISNPNIKIIIYEFEQFNTYQFKSKWEQNHQNNHLLKNIVDWKVNMLWSEKIHMVKNTMDEKYFESDLYVWCDVGYFRNRPNDLNTSELTAWLNPNSLTKIDTNKIYYGLVNNDLRYIQSIYSLVSNKNSVGLPNVPLPPRQISIAGGFFICHRDELNWFHDCYYNKLKLYFDNNYLVKDDQIILADCIFSDINHFCLCIENDVRYDNWFMFQRILS